MCLPQRRKDAKVIRDLSGLGALVVFAFVLAACAATKLDQLQQEYSRLFVTMQAAEQAEAGSIRGGGQRHVFQFELAEVARQAKTEADRTGDPRTAIHFYTVGALAAWQAGPEGEKLLVTISEKGLARCKAMGDSRTVPPRDCAQLAVVPTLAINDALVLELSRLMKKEIAEPVRLDTAKDLVGRTRENLRRLHNSRDVLRTIDGLSPSFVAYYERQKYKLYCNHRESITQLGETPNVRNEAIAADKLANELLLPMLSDSLPRKECFEFCGDER